MSGSGGLALSVLDLSPVVAGSNGAEALQRTLDLARFVDGLGYRRYWLAEHHNTAGIASTVPEIMIGQVAAVTRSLRVGSGGVMLPNHAPLRVCEAFRMLEALFPGRIDLGIGRAPGTDLHTASALRRSLEASSDGGFPVEVQELLGFLSVGFPEDHPYAKIKALPEGGTNPEPWMLGSSDVSGRLAAKLGLGFAFAHHLNPTQAVSAFREYQATFCPSRWSPEPRGLMAVMAICAETDDEADELARSMDLAWLRIAEGRRGPLPTVEEANAHPYTADERELIRQGRARHFVGSPQTLKRILGGLCAEAGVSELMVVSLVHDHEKRKRSYALLAEAFQLAVAKH
jgi:luciferase family oxidoreductase group 1